MNKKILTSALGLVAAAGLVGGGTFAQFSDQEISSVQSVEAGTLDLDFDLSTPSHATAQTAPFAVTEAEPGDSGSKFIKVKNVGNVPLGLIAKVVIDSDAENTCTEPEVVAEPTCAADALGELDTTMYASLDGFVPTDSPPTLAGLVARGSLMPWNATTSSFEPRVLAPGETWLASVTWNIPSTIGNEIQDDSVSWKFQFDAVQV